MRGSRHVNRRWLQRMPNAMNLHGPSLLVREGDSDDFSGGPASRQPRTPWMSDASADSMSVAGADSRVFLDRAGKSDMLLVAGARSFVALAGLFTIWQAPEPPARFIELPYGLLVAYFLYSVWALWSLSRARARLPNRALGWVDVLVAFFFAALTDGTSNIAFCFFSFAILSAAFTHGYREGMRASIACAILFAVSALVMSPLSAAGIIDRTVILPVFLLLLGLLISRWAGSELELKQRLAFLREIGAGINFRAGALVSIDVTLRRLCMFFGADSATLALKARDVRTTGTIYIASASDATPCERMAASDETIALFMAVPQRAITWPRQTFPERYVELDTPSRVNEVRDSAEVVSALAHLLEAKCIAIAGYRQSDGVEGRLVLARAGKRFRDGDAMFLAQCSQAFAAVVENVTLTEELIARTAEYERLTISRDLHDTAIQPYIALRMALEGTAREFRGNDQVAERLAQLVEMTELGIQELRDYAARLTSSIAGDIGALGPAIERQAARFARFYAMDVEVKIDPSLRLHANIADAVFQMIAEGLSNVVRHTAARRVRIAVWGDDRDCILEIANPLPDGVPGPRSFVPRSIAERASDLGGRITVKPSRNGYTIVTVTIPRRIAEI